MSIGSANHKPPPGPYYQQSGEYTICKAYCSGTPVYTAWYGKEMLDSHLAYKDAVENVRRHRYQNSSD
jgi:hypothetical protein